MNTHDAPEARELASLQAQMQRPSLATNQDGSFELGWGLALLCFGFIPYLTTLLHKVSYGSWVSGLLFLCAVFAPYAVPKLIKRSVTWPRTGYVAVPNEIKFIQLVKLMVFGAALGFAASLPLILVSEIRDVLRQAPTERHLGRILLHGIEFLVCVAVAIYLGRTTIRKREPLPTAYNGALIHQQLSQVSGGRTILWTVRFVLLGMFVGVPVLVGAVVIGLAYASSLSGRTELRWQDWAFICLVVATNGILYLMANGVALRQHRWKWTGFALLVAGPILLAPVMPLPAFQQEWAPLSRGFPPVALFLGGIWVLSGLATLGWFIRHNPPRALEAIA